MVVFCLAAANGASTLVLEDQFVILLFRKSVLVGEPIYFLDERKASNALPRPGLGLCPADGIVLVAVSVICGATRLAAWVPSGTL
jgi:hypothetical protein